MDNIEKIGKIEMIALIITVIGNNIIINLPSIILKSSGTGSWINIIYLAIICLVFVLVICKLFKPFVNCDILDISEFLGKKPLKIIIGILYILFFFSFSTVCLRYFTNSLKFIYFNSTPLVLLIILLLIPSAIASKYGLKSIAGANLVFIPITIIATAILFLASSKYFVWQKLFPVLGYGAKETFLSQSSNIIAFNVIAYLYFLKPSLKEEKNFKKVSVFAVIICGIYLLVSVASLLMSFIFIINSDDNFSLYLLTRLISFGKFLQRVDAIFIFIWILNTISFISFNIFIISNILKKILNVESSSSLVLPTASLFLAGAISFRNIAPLKFYYGNYYKIFIIVLVFIISFIISLLAYRKKKKEGVHL